jgi:hypothetical protein
MPDTLGPTAVGGLQPPEPLAIADATQDTELKLRRLRADTDKAELELQKLRADITKAQVEAAAAPAAPGLERARVYLAAITSLGAVLTIGGIVFQQQAQTKAQLRAFAHSDSVQSAADRRDAASKRAAEVAALMREYGRADGSSARIAAIAGLAGYGSDSALRPAIQRLLIESVRVVDAPDVRDAALETLVGMADSALLAGLAQANRRVRHRIRDHLARTTAPEGIDDLADLRVEAWTSAAITTDTALGRLVRDLEWYADALVLAINAAGVVRGQDFHEVHFTPLRLRAAMPGASGVHAVAFTGLHPLFRRGLRFARVNFQGAVLGEQLFDRATFDTAHFAGAVLLGSRFTESVLRNVDLRGVRTYVGGYGSEVGATPAGNLVFADCTLEHSRLSPRILTVGRGAGAWTAPGVHLLHTRWMRAPRRPGTMPDSLPGDSAAVLSGVLTIPRAIGGAGGSVTLGPVSRWSTRPGVSQPAQGWSP